MIHRRYLPLAFIACLILSSWTLRSTNEAPLTRYALYANDQQIGTFGVVSLCRNQGNQAPATIILRNGRVSDARAWLNAKRNPVSAKILANGLELYSVDYGMAMSQPNDIAGWLTELSENPHGNGEPCGNGKVYETPSADDLPDILEEIARELPIMLVQ